MEILLTLFLGKPLWLWLTFFSIVFVLLVLDLGILNKGDEEIGVAKSLKLSAFYVTLGVLFAGFVWWQIGAEAAGLYLTAGTVEFTQGVQHKVHVREA